MSSSKNKVTYGLTPQQQVASDILLQLANRNMSARYPGSFAVDIGDLESGDLSIGLQRLGVDPAIFGELVKTGFATDTTELTNQTRQVGREQVARAFEDAVARASEAGGAFSSAARAAGVKAATGEAAKYELGVLQQVLGAQEAAAQRRMMGLQLAMQAAQTAQALGIDAAKVRLAAQQFTSGMDYEEWKRQNPDTFTLLATLFGRNVDTHIQQNPSWVGPALLAISRIVAAAISDRDLKTDIVEMDDSVFWYVMQLRPVFYKWVSPEFDDGSEMGLIAQEVEELFPSLVHTTAGGYKTVDYVHLVALLVKSIQVLALRITALEDKYGNNSFEK